MRIRVTHGLAGLERDCRKVAVTANRRMAKVVRTNAEQGNRLAKGIARKSAGAHGRHYPNAFTAEARSPLVWEYGPDASKPQGGMSFEFGSRNQPPHLDLAKSADIQGPRFARDASNIFDGLFW